MTDTFAMYSLVLVYSAMAVYALAFIVFALDLGRRAAATPAEELVAATAVTAKRGSTAVLERPKGAGSSGAGAASETKPARSRFARIALALTILAWIAACRG